MNLYELLKHTTKKFGIQIDKQLKEAKVPHALARPDVLAQRIRAKEEREREAKEELIQQKEKRKEAFKKSQELMGGFADVAIPNPDELEVAITIATTGVDRKHQVKKKLTSVRSPKHFIGSVRHVIDLRFRKEMQANKKNDPILNEILGNIQDILLLYFVVDKLRKVAGSKRISEFKSEIKEVLTKIEIVFDREGKVMSQNNDAIEDKLMEILHDEEHGAAITMIFDTIKDR